MSIKWGATWPFRGVSEACTGAHIGACCQPARSMFAQPAVWYLHRSYRNPRRSVYLERENQQKSLVWFMESGSVLWPRSKNTARWTLVKRHLWAPEPASYSYHSRHGNGRLGRLIPLFFSPVNRPRVMKRGITERRIQGPQEKRQGALCWSGTTSVAHSNTDEWIKSNRLPWSAVPTESFMKDIKCCFKGFGDFKPIFYKK